MFIAALDRAGSEDYLLDQSRENPRAFLSLVGPVIPTQLTGAGGKDLIPERASDPQRVTQALLLLLRALPAPAESGEDHPEAENVLLASGPRE
jgi:hypothetical protein